MVTRGPAGLHRPLRGIGAALGRWVRAGGPAILHAMDRDAGDGGRVLSRSGPEGRGPQAPRLIESKLAAPPERPGEIARPSLVARVLAPGAPVISIVGAAGYGKTTLLRQVAVAATAAGRPVAWLALDARDDDPANLVAYLAEALSRIGSADPGDLAALTSRAAPLERVVLPHLAAIVGSLAPGVLVVIDDAHLIRGTAAADVLRVVADRLPAGATLVVAGRGDPMLPLARLRVSGGLAELGPDDLALAPSDAAGLVRAAGATIDDADVHVLLAETEGWPAAVYLAAMAGRSGSGRVGIGFTGRDRHMADYVRQEPLDPLPASTRAFMVGSSVLGRMTPALCDEMLGRDDAAVLLSDLESANRLVIALDRERRWYRFHPLLRDVLREELDATGREHAHALAARASAWFADEGEPEEAIDLARESGDRSLFAALIGRYILPFYRVGRLSTVRLLLAEMGEAETLVAHPDIAAIGAIAHALAGEPGAADRWADAAEVVVRREPDAGGGTTAGLYALLASLVCRNGTEAMLRDAAAAIDLLGPLHPLTVSARFSQGAALALEGRAGEAIPVLSEAAEVGIATTSVDAAIGSTAVLASLHASAGDWTAARRHAREASDLVAAFGTEHYQSAALVHAMSARVAAREGRRDDARTALVRAQVLRPLLTHAIPWFAVLAQVELGRAYLALGDTAGARTAIREAREILVRRPHLGVLPAQVDALRSAVDAHAAGVAGASSLTRAEFRLLPYLPFHLTFDEIAERLDLSTHTVKTQARSIYGKLGAASRGEAVERAVEIGLLDGDIARTG